MLTKTPFLELLHTAGAINQNDEVHRFKAAQQFMLSYSFDEVLLSINTN